MVSLSKWVGHWVGKVSSNDVDKLNDQIHSRLEKNNIATGVPFSPLINTLLMDKCVHEWEEQYSRSIKNLLGKLVMRSTKMNWAVLYDS